MGRSDGEQRQVKTESLEGKCERGWGGIGKKIGDQDSGYYGVKVWKEELRKNQNK